MALDLFRVIQGLDIQLDDLSKNANVLVGDGAPGGTTETNAAPIGSIWLRTDAETDGLNLYWKHTTVNNSTADWNQATDKTYVDAVAAGLSWREPARVQDSVSTTIPTGVAGNPITVDGVSIVDGDRVLFSNQATGTDNNVWIYDQATGTFSEDPNGETDGDALLIQEGSAAEQQWVYDGTAWVQFGGATSAAELGYIRTFIGKTGAGAENPTYSSTDVITQGEDLEHTIGELDAAIGTQTYTNDNIVTDGQDVTSSIDAIDTAIGNQTYTNDNIVTDGQTVTASIDAIDTALGDVIDQTLVITGTNVDAAPAIPVDTIPVTEATEVKWILQVRSTGTPANRRALEVHAMTDGTNVDHTEYAVLKLGSNIAGLTVDVDVSGGDIRLVLGATANVDYVIKRIGYTAF
jgi:hypothetical protein